MMFQKFLFSRIKYLILIFLFVSFIPSVKAIVNPTNNFYVNKEDEVSTVNNSKSNIIMEDNRRKNFLSHYYCRNYKTTSNNCSPHKIKTSELNHLVFGLSTLFCTIFIRTLFYIQLALNNQVNYVF